VLGRLVIVGLLALVSLALAMCSVRGEQVGQSLPTLVSARIVSFGSTASKINPAPLVTLALDDGSLVTIGASPAWADGCQAGDRVALHRRGLNHKAATPSCREL
jgi:hypothetical protein